MNDKTTNMGLFSQDFIYKNLMGPNCLKILRELIKDIEIKPNMRILDLGCGTGLTSIYLAKNFDVTVFATDLWIKPSENYERIKQFNLEDKVYPIYANALSLPYADEFFDIVISVGAYNCFGCKSDYLQKCLLPLVKKEGLICVSVPGVKIGFDGIVPEELTPFWQENMNFYSFQWWHKLPLVPWLEAIKLLECIMTEYPNSPVYDEAIRSMNLTKRKSKCIS
ncbi:Cyclopropane fatty-acyl-phospholipid synthase [Anaerovirgula multivorans]|uniref:Cyclopropane fatty-acyl-phospholipid synthase n=1 Tax=Anaerovirgula multivorans TaxID=312168 RepID=A0A239J8S3_9FIRM|nr:methyltransferase domain-containing protein [Anaerovirgula multivorans]SNT02230.1 Cyclopropane fatty-acyl-phospholipid synthase [Anaerovirgula multivorans]